MSTNKSKTIAPGVTNNDNFGADKSDVSAMRKTKKEDLKETALEIFTDYYRQNYWGNEESRSGKGSTRENASLIVERFPWLIKKLDIKSILDLPCGDMNFMKLIDFEGVKYTGVDIVEDIIECNKKLFPQHQFLHLDAQSDPLPQTDLVICRDLLIHLPNISVNKILKNIVNSSSKYLLVSHYLQQFGPVPLNGEIQTGQFRAVNLTLPPFSLPVPTLMLPEKQSPYKTLALFDLGDIQIRNI
jgi:SAM-dependent methyltransferase